MSDALIKYRNFLLGILIAGAMFSLYFIETLHNGGFAQSSKYLSIPIAILTFLFFKINLEKLKQKLWPNSRFKPWLYCLAVYLVTMLMVWPNYVAINAITGSGKTQVIAGDIVRKFTSGSKSRSYNVAVLDDRTNTEIELTIGKVKYEVVQVGDEYSECFYVGSFEILYRWRDSPVEGCPG